jgi:hypothetical protein
MKRSDIPIPACRSLPTFDGAAMKYLSLPALWAVWLCSTNPALAATPAQEKEGLAFFESKVRPVLVKHCYECHSQAARKNKKLKGGLLLDSRDGLRKGGDSGPAIVPGYARESLLLRALRHESTKMPPKGKLSDTVIADVAKWIDLGAPDPRDGSVLPGKRLIDIETARKSWAFRPLASVQPPSVKNASWARTPIDRFILASLEAKGLSPARPLDREKLLRRATFDLTGLPPTPAEIDDFGKDDSPGAYEKRIDRMLQSERYGERWARHWLDVARFAESGGYEFDGDRPGAYQYRDFVIKALNRDMPYDEFVRLQLAGDHLEPGNLLATAATGFLVAGPYPGQTTAKTLEPIRYDHLDDMISTVGTAFLGLTVGCARCHEHKYDPIPQQDYYHLIASLSRTDSAQLRLDPTPEHTRRLKAAFDKEHGPVLAALSRFEKEELPGRLTKWLVTEKARSLPQWLILDPVIAAGPPPFKKQSDGSLRIVSSGDTLTLVAHTFQQDITAFRLDALPDPSLPKQGPGRAADGSFRLTAASMTAASLPVPGKPPRTIPVKFRSGLPFAGPAGKPQSVILTTEAPINIEGGTILTLTLTFAKGQSLGRFRLALSAASSPKLTGEARLQHGREVLAVMDAQGGQADGKHRAQLLRWFREVDSRTNEVLTAVEKHALLEPKPTLVPVFAATSGRGGDVHYLIRGETERKNGVARTGFLQVLTNTPEGDSHWTKANAGTKAAPISPRISLANWITDSKHGAGHLLARVMVNRIWQHHFGKGLVRTPNDFGAQGESPTHPELLDWLASELIRGDWKLKPLHKLIMSSAVYQQSGTNASGSKLDPKNLLWSRVPTRRLDAESIRDALLVVGGQLDTTMYGPGTLDENSARRSVYLTVKRSQLVPLLQAFDAPEGITGMGERLTTTATTQALAMMNSALVRQSAERLAKRIVKDKTDGPAVAIERAYLLALGRRPTPGERDRMLGFIARLTSESQASRTPDQALADFCQVLLCLNEFIYID